MTIVPYIFCYSFISTVTLQLSFMRKRAKAVQWLTRRGLSRWVVYLEDEEEGVVDLDQVCVLAKKNGGDALRVRHYKRRYVKTTFLPIVCLFTILMTCYFLNGSEFCISHDITANLFLPLNLLKYGTLFFRPERWPPLFYWKLDGFENSRCVLEPMHLANVTSPVAAGLLKLGHLSLRNEQYFMIPVISSSNTYANIFGLGAGLTALPVVSIMKLTELIKKATNKYLFLNIQLNIETELYLHINSGGGDVFAVLSIINLIQTNKLNINTNR